MKTVEIDEYDAARLACHILGLEYSEIDEDRICSIIEDKLYEEFEISLGGFTNIISRLLPIIEVATSKLTKQTYKGFASNLEWLIKIKHEPNQD